jgi:putative proteasome-type protease
MRLFLVYSAGNFIEATRETCYFQIGESKYGKPVLDRLLTPETSLADGAKCALLSMDSTMKSNLSVGLPLDLAVYRAGELESHQLVCIDEHNPYYRMVRDDWDERLRAAFEGVPAPALDDSQVTQAALCVPSARYRPLQKIANPDERLC